MLPQSLTPILCLLIDDMLHRMSKAEYSTRLDVVSAFWQIPMEETDIPFTAFITPNGKFEWARMPFGLRNASSTFQRFIDDTLQDLDFAVGYIDDIFIFSNTWEEHLAHLLNYL